MINKQFYFLIYFQIAWFVVVWLGSKNHLLAPVILSLLSWLIFISISKPSTFDLLYLAGRGLFGASIDFALVQLHFYNFNPEQFNFQGMPFWFILIWALYSSVHGIYLKIFSKYSVIWGSLAFGLFAPLSYLGAQKIAVFTFEYHSPYFILAVFWFFYFYISSKLRLFLERFI